MKTTLLLLSSLMISLVSLGQTDTWRQITVPTNENLYCIDFPSIDVGYIGGNTGVLLKTIDGGLTWNTINFNTIGWSSSNLPVGPILDLHFVDEINGYMLMHETLFSFIPTTYTNLWKTNDGGVNWEYIPTPSYLSALYVKNMDHILTGGSLDSSSFIINEYNNSSWSQNSSFEASFGTISSPFGPTITNNENISEIDFLGSLGLASTNSNFILRSTDTGQSWDTISSGLDTNYHLNSILIVDAFNSYAGYSSNGNVTYGLLKSEDGGLTWFQDMNSATFFYPDWTCLAQSSIQNNAGLTKIYAGGSIDSWGAGTSFPNGIIFSSSDGFQWDYTDVDYKINDITSNDYEAIIDFLGNTEYRNNTFAVGDSGYVVTNRPIIANSIEDSFSKSSINIYPNPAKEMLYIELDIEKNWKINLLDASMKQTNLTISSLEIQNGINISSLSKGIYFLVLYNDNEKIIKKLIKS
ncbi:MAG: hypothetical protein CMD01_03410 [Flavobacteriales bacterium]|nr:hypothetical protein [Flavobacteriales bacterium]